MSSSFFLKKAIKPNRKRKATEEVTGVQKAKKPKISAFCDISKRKRKSAIQCTQFYEDDGEEIDSEDEELDIDVNGESLVFSSDDEKEETPQDKRLRLAKQYLLEVEKQEAERADEHELINQVEERLKTEYLDSVGRLRRTIAGSIHNYDTTNIITLKHKLHHGSICALALTADGKYLFAGAKSQHVLKWNTETRKIDGYFDVQPYKEDDADDSKRHSHVIALCVSSDGKYLALAESGKNIQIWCPNTLKHIKTFQGHRDIVTALIFRRGTHELYSAAKDRSVKIWSLDEMAYVESLFGHQTGITSIDALSRERAITAGGSDYSLRIWKITEEMQLIYNGHKDSIEIVKFINDEEFISGGCDGALNLWSALRKKPICTTELAHGKGANQVPNWITALAVVINTDLVASGSYDGCIRLWQTISSERKLKLILEIPVCGFINSLVFNNEGTKLYAGIGQEHRAGRWWRIKEAKNNILVFNLIQNKT